MISSARTASLPSALDRRSSLVITSVRGIDVSGYVNPLDMWDVAGLSKVLLSPNNVLKASFGTLTYTAPDVFPGWSDNGCGTDVNV